MKPGLTVQSNGVTVGTRITALPYLIGSTIVVVLLYLTARTNYLLFHSLVEAIRIAVLWSVFSVGWLSRRWVNKTLLIVLAISACFVGFIETLHMLSYKGLGVFPESGGNLPTQLWIAFRYVEAISLLAGILLMRRDIPVWSIVAVCAAICGTLLVSIFIGAFPDCFIEGSGLTPFKVNSEYAIIGLLGVGAWWLYLRREEIGHPFAPLLIGSVVFGMVAEFSFTRYVSVYGSANEIGHGFLLVSTYLLYRAFVVTGIVHPMDILFDQLRRNEADLQRAVVQKTDELTDQARRLNDILIGTNAGTWEWNVQTGEAIFNERWAEMLGYKLAELMPVSIATWQSLAHPEDLQQSDQLLSRHFSGELSDYTFESRMRHKDGHWVWVVDRGRVAKWTEDGKPLLMSGTHQDISEQKQTEAELTQHRNHLEEVVHTRTSELAQSRDAAEAANRAKSVFLTTMSHELRTPLNGVMGMTDLALGRATDSVQIDWLSKSQSSAKHLLNVLNDILNLSKIEADLLALEENNFSLAQIIGG